MDQINWLRIKRISLVLLANAGLSIGFLAAGAFIGGGYALLPLLIVQPLILVRMMKNYEVKSDTAVFLSILLTVTGWIGTFLILAMAGGIQC